MRTKTAHIVIIGNKVNLAVDGGLFHKLPAFPTVMSIIASIVGILMNGLMGVCISIIFSSIIIKIALSNVEPKFGEAKKILDFFLV